METDSETDALKDLIRAAGLRATPARVSTLCLLRQATSPKTHAEVTAALEEADTHPATVFRILNDMAEAGLLRRLELGDYVYRFEAVRNSDSNRGLHPYFLCVDCGEVTCLEEVNLTASNQHACEEVGEMHEIILRGVCNQCR